MKALITKMPTEGITLQAQTRTLLAAASLCAGLLMATTGANAALIDQGATVYDNDRGISWLKDANLAATNTFGVSGINASGYMDWNTAQGWIGAMNSANYLGYSDWRLPTTLQPDTSCENHSSAGSGGFNCTGSEMGHLFYSELGGAAGVAIAITHNANYSLFSDLQSSVYWSGTEWATFTGNAWYFAFNGGIQDPNGEDSNMYALAVRPGQVAAVPLPAAAWLFGSGLLGLISVARRKARTL